MRGDWVAWERLIKAAIKAGLIRENHGHSPDWGSLSVTAAGRAAISVTDAS